MWVGGVTLADGSISISGMNVAVSPVCVINVNVKATIFQGRIMVNVA